ncbi:hypothetical protein HL42_4608 [Trichophyton rubrum]|nr:hypothetical protein HL42_4608 [Trichophyton rubrum]
MALVFDTPSIAVYLSVKALKLETLQIKQGAGKKQRRGSKKKKHFAEEERRKIGWQTCHVRCKGEARAEQDEWTVDPMAREQHLVSARSTAQRGFRITIMREQQQIDPLRCHCRHRESFFYYYYYFFPSIVARTKKQSLAELHC